MTIDVTAAPSRVELEEMTLEKMNEKMTAVEEEDGGEEVEEDFSPLGKIEGWSAFECSSGPFGFRG